MSRFLIAAALLAAATFAHAQQLPPGKWWQRPEVVERLGLTSEQQERLDEIFRAAANGLIDAKGDVEKIQIAMRAELDRPQIRRQEVLRLASQLNDARGRLFAREVTMLIDMRAVLTEQQWKQMRAQLDRLRERPLPNRKRR
jgi:Spy/CpxP family protein refolding chaperone